MTAESITLHLAVISRAVCAPVDGFDENAAEAIRRSVASLRRIYDDMRAVLREVAASGVESDDPRLPYVVVQIDRETWRRALELGGKGAV